MQRVPKNGTFIRVFHQVAQVHHADVVGNVLHHRKVVGDEQVGEFQFFLQIHQQVDNLRLNGDIQRRQRLVAHDELRVQRERARDADALALAADFLLKFCSFFSRFRRSRLIFTSLNNPKNPNTMPTREQA